MRTQDKEPRPFLGAFHKSRSHTKICRISTERLPARAGKTSKRKIKEPIARYEYNFGTAVTIADPCQNGEAIFCRNNGNKKRFTCGRWNLMDGSEPRNPAASSLHGYARCCKVILRCGDRSFPQYGRFFDNFSMLWKIFSSVFHTMEEMFPWCGKLGF